jgi:hypothetical protein
MNAKLETDDCWPLGLPARNAVTTLIAAAGFAVARECGEQVGRRGSLRSGLLPKGQELNMAGDNFVDDAAVAPGPLDRPAAGQVVERGPRDRPSGRDRNGSAAGQIDVGHHRRHDHRARAEAHLHPCRGRPSATQRLEHDGIIGASVGSDEVNVRLVSDPAPWPSVPARPGRVCRPLVGYLGCGCLGAPA